MEIELEWDDEMSPEEEAHIIKLVKRHKRRTGFLRYYRVLEFKTPMVTQLIIECAIWGRRLFVIPLWKRTIGPKSGY